MLSQGNAFVPQTLWCGEYLNESPSTWTYSENRHVVRKEPLSELPNSSCSHIFTEFLQFENEYACNKKPLSDQCLNTPQSSYVPVDIDKQIHWDNRVLKSLLETEKNSYSRYRNLQNMIVVQGDSKYLVYRAEASKWLLDVCTEESCDFGIFPLAVTYLNRILFLQKIPTKHLQVLASACLFIASKMKAPQPLTAQRLAEYSDNYVRADEILKWEILIVNLLNWDISLHTVFEFFDQLMVRAPALEILRESFCKVAYSIQTDEKLCCLLPSIQCALAVCFLTLNTNVWFDYRSLVKTNFKIDFADLKSLLLRLNPNLKNIDLHILKPTETRQRCSIYQSSNPFVAFV